MISYIDEKLEGRYRKLVESKTIKYLEFKKMKNQMLYYLIQRVIMNWFTITPKNMIERRNQIHQLLANSLDNDCISVVNEFRGKVEISSELNGDFWCSEIWIFTSFIPIGFKGLLHKSKVAKFAAILKEIVGDLKEKSSKKANMVNYCQLGEVLKYSEHGTEEFSLGFQIENTIVDNITYTTLSIITSGSPRRYWANLDISIALPMIESWIGRLSRAVTV